MSTLGSLLLHKDCNNSSCFGNLCSYILVLDIYMAVDLL